MSNDLGLCQAVVDTGVERTARGRWDLRPCPEPARVPDDGLRLCCRHALMFRAFEDRRYVVTAQEVSDCEHTS